MPGQHIGERRFSRTRRTPEDDGEEAVLLNGSPQKAVRSEEMTLPHVFIESPRPHPVGQRPIVALSVLLSKKVHPGVLQKRGESSSIFFASA